MAYLQRLHGCYECNAPATHKLFGAFHQLRGYYCEKHAQQALRRLDEAERQTQGKAWIAKGEVTE
jgi:hypothetical protein